MKKKLTMLAAVLLALCAIFNICALGVHALYPMAGMLWLDIGGASLQQKPEGVSLILEKGGAYVRFGLDKSMVRENANSLSLVLSNRSLCNTASLEIKYIDGSVVRADIDINKYGMRKTYTVPLENCESIEHVTMHFGGASAGEILFHSIFASEIFKGEKLDRGDISSCEVSNGKLTLKGTLHHDTVIKHQKNTLSLYALKPDQTLDDIYGGKIKPIAANVALTIRFEISAVLNKDYANLFRYVVVINSEDGLLPVCEPAYPDIKVSDYNINFKGIETNVVSGALESGAGLSVLELSLSDIVSDGNYGYMVTIDDNRYFFNRNYVSQLDSKIKTLSGSSCDVFIRLSEFTAVYTEQEQMQVYALVKFLSDRYSNSSVGHIKGYILGESINEKITEGKTFSEYIEACYCLAYTVAAAASSENNPAAVVFSVSDSWGTEVEKGSVSAEMFISSLFSVLDYYDSPVFAIMPEICTNPYGVDDTYILQNGGKPDIGERDVKALQKASAEAERISIENFNLFCLNYADLVSRFQKIAPKLICSWVVGDNTSGSAMTASYVYAYYTMFFSEYISSFIVSFKEANENEISKLNDLRYKMRYMDTEKSADAGEFAKTVFGLADWKQDIENFDPKALKTRTVKDSFEIMLGASKDIFGTFSYWDFSSNSSHNGWYSGVNCNSIAIESRAGDGRALCAKMNSDSTLLGEYAFLAYTYENKESFKYNDYLVLDFSISAEDTHDSFEMKLTLGGAGFLYEYNASDLVPGSRYTVCIDIRDMTEKELVEYIRIGTKNSTNGKDYSLKLYSVSAASAKYSNEDLADLIYSEKDRILGLNQAQNPKAGPELIILAAVTLIATAVAMIMVSRGKKNARPEDRAE